MTSPRLVDGILVPDPVLSRRQEQVLRFLWAYYQEKRAYPTHGEIAAGIGARPTALPSILLPMEGKGVILRAHRGQRNARITKVGLQVLQKLGVVDAQQLELVGG